MAHRMIPVGAMAMLLALAGCAAINEATEQDRQWEEQTTPAEAAQPAAQNYRSLGDSANADSVFAPMRPGDFQ